MYIKEDYNFEDLQKRCWQGAINTLKIIQENNKEDDFMVYLESYFKEYSKEGERYFYAPTITEINDFLWFKDNVIFNDLGIEVDE